MHTYYSLRMVLELLQIKNFKGDFKIAKILKYPNEVRLKLIFKGEKVILQHVYYSVARNFYRKGIMV